MKRLAAGIFLLFIVTTAAAQGVHRFDNGLWFDGKRFVPRTVFSIDGLIRFEPPPGVSPATVTDLKGTFVIPPFADAHHHAFADGRDPAETIAAFLRDGVFYVKNPNNLPRLAAAIRPRVNRPETVDVIYSNGGFTSTGGHPTQIYARMASQIGMSSEEMAGEAYFIVDEGSDLDAVWESFLGTGPDFVKVYLEHSEEHARRAAGSAFAGKRGLDPRILPLLVRRAHDAGLSVSAHVATASDFRAALASGVDEITHLPLERLTKEDAKEAARRRTRVVTTTISHRPTGGIENLDAIHSHNLKLLRAAGAPLAIGTDNDPTAMVEAENIHRLGVFDPATLLTIWTRDTAQAIFPDRKIGRLEEGYEASFLALAGNPLDDFRNIRKIASRVKQGHPLVIPERKTRPLATEKLIPVAMSEGAAAAIRAYDRMRAEQSDAYDTSERALNQLGYILLRHAKVDPAIEIFTANVERFPSSFNVYDSLGEAQMAKGDNEAAIRNYEKSLQLNPHNNNAAEKLKKIRADILPVNP